MIPGAVPIFDQDTMLTTEDELGSKSTHDLDTELMRAALGEAETAAAHGEVPVGAVVYHDGDIIARAHNRRECDGDPTAHAEIIAIRAASRAVGSWRLSGCTLVVTLEPCPMCSGALINARVDRLVYGAPDPKMGCVHSLHELCTDARFNHRLSVTGGVLADECGKLLTDFFQTLRTGERS